MAVGCGDVKSVALLIQRGADVTIFDRSRLSALMVAARFGNNICVQLLIEAGADVNNNVTGVTALMLAAHYGNESCVKQLINTGGDVNKSDGTGKTTLMFALEGGYGECLKLLIEAGADRWGYKLMCHIIREEAKCDVAMKRIKVLLMAGACININGENMMNLGNVGQNDDKKELFELLSAAGETLKKDLSLESPEQMSLMNLCRVAIRRHLLELDAHVNLLVRIPNLGLPPRITEYVLYGVSPSDGEL